MHQTHSHSEPVDFGPAFQIGITLNLLFVVVEAASGWVLNSLALVADAGHNFSDVLGLLLAWGAILLARRPGTARRTYGFRRASILAANLNALLLVVAVGAIGWEAVHRFVAPAPVPGAEMIWVALIGTIINLATAVLFLRGHHDLNIRGACLHMLADAGISLGVVVAGVFLQFTAWTWIDPAASLAIAAVVFWGTWRLLRESLDLALDAVPAGVDPEEIREHLAAIAGVQNVHDLHIWALSTTETALTAHLAVESGCDSNQVLSLAATGLHDRFGIEHSTLQIEFGTPTCVSGDVCH